MERSGGSIKAMMIKQHWSLWWDFSVFLHRNGNMWIGSTVHISELVFMPLHLKHNFKVTGYVKKNKFVVIHVYIFVSAGLHWETNIYWFASSFSKSSISYIKIR